MCHLPGHRFAPRIKDLKNRKLYAIEKPGTYPVLKPLIGEAVDTAALVRGWAELARVRASIEAGAVAPSTIPRKLAAAGPNNALSRALRALGRIERTLLTLQRRSGPALRQRSHAGLNKGEAGNARRQAVFFRRQGEFRDRTFENQSFRASGLSLLTAAIVPWNAIPLDQAVRRLRAQGVPIPDKLLAHVAPFGWEHIALTGGHDWNTARPANRLRPLRPVPEAFTPRAAWPAGLSKQSGDPNNGGPGHAASGMSAKPERPASVVRNADLLPFPPAKTVTGRAPAAAAGGAGFGSSFGASAAAACCTSSTKCGGPATMARFWPGSGCTVKRASATLSAFSASSKPRR